VSRMRMVDIFKRGPLRFPNRCHRGEIPIPNGFSGLRFPWVYQLSRYLPFLLFPIFSLSDFFFFLFQFWLIHFPFLFLFLSSFVYFCSVLVIHVLLVRTMLESGTFTLYLSNRSEERNKK
jgi:hypothetical protein